MPAPVKILAAGLPAEIVREIGLRLRDVVITEFDDALAMAEAVATAGASVAILSDSFPTEDSTRLALRAREGGGKTQIVYCVSMQQAENTLSALSSAKVDRFFFSPVDMDEVLRELSRICRVEVLPRHASHDTEIAAAVAASWNRARIGTFDKVDKLDDAAIALLENAVSSDLIGAATRNAHYVAESATRFGFQKAATIAKDLAEHFANGPLTPGDGVQMAEQLLALREELSGDPTPPAASESLRATERDTAAGFAFDESSLEGKHVLVVDDEPMISSVLVTLFEKRRLSVTAVNDPLQFWSALDQAKPDLILLDLEMPRVSGAELCRVVRSDPRWNELPVIFLTGHTDQASVHRMFAAGADDYVGKPFVPAELTMRVESRLAGMRARRAPLETDPLTGLAAPRKATELIGRFLRLARRKGDPYSIAVIQVDDFAELTNTYGRTLTDAVLRSIGELLPKCFRGEDVAGWWGASDFTVGMYGSSKDYAAIKLAEVCKKIGELFFVAADGRRVQVAVTGGVSEYQVDGEGVETLREAAGKALAQVRATAGANRVGISGAKVAGPLVRRVDVAIVLDDAALVALLRHAMETRNLRVASFGDGETAAAALTGSAPEVQASVILLGVDLPALNGLDVLRRLKAGEVTRASSVVMLTARSSESDILAALELGAIDHVVKPFSVPVLMHKVRTVLKQARA